MNLYERIPNNVNLSEDKKLQRALEKWLPNYLDWWQEMGPDGFQQKEVYLRTAISVEPDGWANFDFIKMPDYRWGIFLKPAEPDAKIGFGDNYGQPAYQEVPGEFRRFISCNVTLGVTVAMKPTHCSNAAVVIPINHESSKPSTNPAMIGSTFSASRCLRIATASISFRLSLNPVSSRWRAPVSSCSRKRPITCLSATPVLTESLSAPRS